jgi:hypothetical protein
MTARTPDELARIGRADELQTSSRRADDSLRPFVTIWVVRVGDELFVQSAHGRDDPWFGHALTAGSVGSGRAASSAMSRSSSSDVTRARR